MVQKYEIYTVLCTKVCEINVFEKVADYQSEGGSYKCRPRAQTTLTEL